MNEVMTILQGSVVTQTVLGGLTTYPADANFYSVCMSKITKVGWQFDKVIAIIIRLIFGSPCIEHHHSLTGVRAQQMLSFFSEIYYSIQNCILSSI